ncbi:MAG: amino acid ABC transporter permease [Paracoccaceae bacterium]
MTYHWDFSSIIRYRHILIEGIGGMLMLAASAILTAMVVGFVIAMARISTRRLLNWPATVFVAFFRNIPYIVQLFWFFYAMPVLIKMQATPFLAAYLSLSLYGGAYFAEIYRAGIRSLDRGQWEGAKAIGLGWGGMMRYIILPQALRRTIPALTTQTIEMAKLTTVASSIAYFEILYAGKLIADQDLRPIEAYTTVAAVLIAILMVLSWGAARLENRLART